MKYTFYKMQACGNDYIYFDCFETSAFEPSIAAVKLSDRHFGIGGDGIVLIKKCTEKTPCGGEIDAEMRMFNADGSEGRMCGNAIRCVGKYLHDIRKNRKTTLNIKTLSGIKTLSLALDERGEAVKIRVGMGRYSLSPKELPAKWKGERIVREKVRIGGGRYAITCVNVGNPHCVVYVKDPTNIDLERIGGAFENAPMFIDRINTGFVRVDGRNHFTARVWERGSGETLACGTGACAIAVSGILNGYADADEEITVRLPGGELTVRVSKDGEVFLSGGAVFVYSGEVEL